MHFNKSFTDSQAQAEADKTSSLALFESVKDFRERFGVNAEAAIGDFHPDLVADIIARANPESSTFRRKLHSIFYEVPKDLLQPRWIGFETELLSGKVDMQDEVFLTYFFLANLKRVAQKGVRIHDLETELHFALADAGQIEQVVDQSGLQLDVTPNHLQGVAYVIRQTFTFQSEHRRQHRRERGAQLVAEHGEKLVFGEIRAFRFSARLLGLFVKAGEIKLETGALRQLFHERKLILPILFITRNTPESKNVTNMVTRFN